MPAPGSAATRECGQPHPAGRVIRGRHSQLPRPARGIRSGARRCPTSAQEPAGGAGRAGAFPGKRWRKTMPPEMNRPRDPAGSPPRTTLLSEHHPRPGRLLVRGGCSRIGRMFPCRRNFSHPAGTTPTSKSHRFVMSRPVAKSNRSPRPADHPMAIIDPADPMRTVSHTNRPPHANRRAAGPRRAHVSRRISPPRQGPAGCGPRPEAGGALLAMPPCSQEQQHIHAPGFAGAAARQLPVRGGADSHACQDRSRYAPGVSVPECAVPRAQRPLHGAPSELPQPRFP